MKADRIPQERAHMQLGGPVVVEPGDKFRLSVEEMMVVMNLSVMKEASKKEEGLPGETKDHRH